MSKMINTNIRWLPTIPETWRCARVKDLFYISKEQAKQENPTILSLARSGVKERDISNNEGQLAESYFNYNVVKKGDLLLNPMDLYSGANCNVSEVEGVISPAYSNLRAKGELNPKYFDYYFKTQYWTMAMFAHGKGVSFDNRWTLNAEGLLNYELPLPDKEAQDNIVSYLNSKTTKIDALISNQKDQIDKINEIKKSLITNIISNGISSKKKIDSGIEQIGLIPIGWDVRRFKNLGKCRNGLTYSPSDICSSNEGTLVLRSSNIQNNKLVFDDNVYVNCIIDSELMVRENDILICSRNGSAKLIGKNALIPCNISASFGAFMMIYRCEHPEYVRYILSSNIFSQYLGTFLTVSVNQLTGSNFQNIMFPYPKTKEEREAIVNYLDKKCASFDELIDLKRSKIEKLEEYKRSLIYETICGLKEVSNLW